MKIIVSLSLSLCECLFQTPVACCTGQPMAPGIQQLDNIDMYLGSIAGMRQEKVRGVSSIVIWSMIYRDTYYTHARTCTDMYRCELNNTHALLYLCACICNMWREVSHTKSGHIFKC